MSRIKEAIKLRDSIRNNSHYGPCFNGDDYHTFLEKERKLDNIKNCYDNIIDYESLIININNEKNNDNKMNSDTYFYNMDFNYSYDRGSTNNHQTGAFNQQINAISPFLSSSKSPLQNAKSYLFSSFKIGLLSI